MMTKQEGSAYISVLLVGLILLLHPTRIFSAEALVTNLADSGAGSLRNAITAAASGDTISFQTTGVLVLTSGPLMINKNLVIVGPGPLNLAISGNKLSRILEIGAGAVVRISGMRIFDGVSQGGTGGIRNFGTLDLANCIISRNSTTGLVNFGAATLTDCVVTQNTSISFGVGGIENNGTMTLSRTNITANVGFAGGGIVNAGPMNVVESTISDNRTSHSGGAFINGGTLIIERSTISGNSASNTAGAFYNIGVGSLTLINSTVANNQANFGGTAIRNQNTTSAVFLIHVTLTGTMINEGGSIALRNSLIKAIGQGCVGTGFSSSGHNISSDNSCAAFLNGSGDMNGIDPGLAAALQDNGGQSQTIALLPSSPAVNAISLLDCTDLGGSRILTDQRGVSRPKGSGCDIGAYEFVPPVLRVAIDIKPGDARNTVNLKSSGKLPVAILSAAASAGVPAFDATTVNPASVTLADAHVATQGRGTPMSAVQDLNGDGRLDLLLHFNTADLQLPPDTLEAVLYGETWSGDSIRGSDSIRLIQ